MSDAAWRCAKVSGTIPMRIAPLRQAGADLAQQHLRHVIGGCLHFHQHRSTVGARTHRFEHWKRQRRIEARGTEPFALRWETTIGIAGHDRPRRAIEFG